MKKLYLIIFMLGMGLLSAMAQYHIRVNCFYNAGDKYDGDKFSDYKISFTKDNWKTSYSIMEAFDISESWGSTNVCFQEKLFSRMYTSKSDAIEFARQFTSYAKCVEFNNQAKAEYYRLLAYRKTHPIRLEKRIIPKEKCCTITNVY